MRELVGVPRIILVIKEPKSWSRVLTTELAGIAKQRLADDCTGTALDTFTHTDVVHGRRRRTDNNGVLEFYASNFSS